MESTYNNSLLHTDIKKYGKQAKIEKTYLAIFLGILIFRF
ncbi:hypothetical protein SPAR143_1543 [Streptococcus pneumoniae NP070]|nr:hypothetical protein SPAR143_1543 [Streptococcus pneumoniae NP070]EHD82687.1 hypothetical protein SPAR22_2377 [Streptococcus pneumoniae GA11304]